MSQKQIQPTIARAHTEQQKNLIYRFRYEIYVEEMNRYHSIADHERRLLREDVDDQSRLYMVTEGDRLIGAMRFTWGADAPFVPRHVTQYDLKPFLDCITAEQIVVGERFMVSPEYRGTDLLFSMFRTYLEFVNKNRIQLVFGDCEPHLLNLYQGLGFRTYSKRNVNSPETGYLIPLVMIPEDISYMQRINSPLLRVLRDFGEEARVPHAVCELLTKETAIFSQRFSDPHEYWSQIYAVLNEAKQNTISPFDSMTEEQTTSCLKKSSTIECSKGDRVVKKGNVARNMYIVLSGTLEARDGNKFVGALTVGDVFGEMAFLLGTPRTADVYAATDDVKVLSLSESEIRKIIESDPAVAAKLMLNVSKMLCRRMLNRA